MSAIGLTTEGTVLVVLAAVWASWELDKAIRRVWALLRGSGRAGNLKDHAVAGMQAGLPAGGHDEDRDALRDTDLAALCRSGKASGDFVAWLDDHGRRVGLGADVSADARGDDDEPLPAKERESLPDRVAADLVADAEANLGLKHLAGSELAVRDLGTQDVGQLLVDRAVCGGVDPAHPGKVWGRSW